MLKLALGACPGKVATHDRLAQCGMSFSQRWVQTHCCRRRLVGCSRALRKRQHTEDAKPVVIGSDTGVCDSIVRVKRDGLVVTNYGSRKAILSKCIPVETPAQISFVGLRIVCAAFGQFVALITCQF